MSGNGPWITWRWFILGLAAIAVVAGVFWGRDPGDTSGGPELRCPEHDVMIPVDSGIVTDIALATDIDEIPEYHDCQRFIVDERYGPLVAVWAAQNLRALFSGAPVADSAYPVAVVHVADGVYPPLGLKQGFNCLYLWRDGDQPTGWRASMLGLSDRVGDCSDPRSIRSIGDAMPLAVQAMPNPDPGDKWAIPAVARFDTESGGSKSQLIGVRCGDNWCEVGPQAGFIPSRTVRDDPEITSAFANRYQPVGAVASAPVAETRTLLHKGWYDQQVLAHRTASGQLVPSGVIGTIIPNPGLDILSNPDLYGITDLPAPFVDHWVPVGYIHVTGNYDGAKLQLEAGLSSVEFCRGDAGACGVPGGVSGSCPADSEGQQWWRRLTSPGDNVAYACIRMWDHGPNGVIPVGAARWRWHETDETTWFRCSLGCCTEN